MKALEAGKRRQLLAQSMVRASRLYIICFVYFILVLPKHSTWLACNTDCPGGGAAAKSLGIARQW